MNALAERLETPLALLLAAGIAWTLASGIWFFVGGAETADSPLGAPNPSATANPGPAPLPAAGIAALHLFGRAGAAASVDAGAINAPETRLQLELQGVFLAERPEDSSAIIAERNKDGKLYRVGDRLPGNAELAQVLGDRIVLRRSGVAETLRFPNATDAGGVARVGGQRAAAVGRPLMLPGDAAADAADPLDAAPDDTEAFAGPAAIDARPAGDRGQPSVRETIEKVQQQLDVDPEGTLAQYGVEPVADGAGYRIGDQVSAQQLSSVGLKPGDVVLSVNGRAVGDIQQDRQQLQGIVDAGSARLEIQRGDRRFFVTTRIDNNN